ncbi:hypothetical protein RND81_08G188800 [Saponaria officinalis]|uniref:HBS1-like protein n=1 Tax=Saponaria officinalis TaxID=3572 RepID=A0AAW1J9A7_SAPOF
MSRKANYGYDYNDDYDDYDEYEDYEYDEDNDDHQYADKDVAVAVPRETVKSGGWPCSICTYDNHESMTYCEICGVIRFPPSSNSSNIDKKAGAPPGVAEKKYAAATTQSRAKETDITITSKEKTIPSVKNSFTPTSNVLRKINVVEGLPSSKDVGMTKASKGKTISLEENSFTSTSNVLRNIDVVEGLPSTGRSDSFSKMKSNHKGNLGESSSFANGGNTESVSSGLEDMSLNRKPGSSKSILPKKAIAQYKPESWMLPEKESNSMTQLNLAIVGHVDSGKSTLSGRLLHLLGQISQKQMHKFEKEAKQQGKGSFAYAWALDESAEERERGITMTVAVAYFDTKKYHVVVLDSPGHRDFVPNMISGATQADAAVLVIDASVGAYETGMDSFGGQSREHAQLIRSFGVDQVIVAINKMDAVAYSKERFDLIKQQVGSFLRHCGFKESSITWIPVSAMENQNLVASATDVHLTSWYTGPHLLGAIDTLHPPRRDYEKPLLMPICDVVKTHSMGQVSACGKLEAGALRSGTKVLVMPLGEVAAIRSIECNSQPCSIARAGQNVALVLQGIDISNVRAGGVLCHPDFPVRVASHLELKILVLDVKIPILTGSQVEFHIHHAKEAARVVKIVSLLDPKTGKATKKAPRHLLAKQSAVIEVALQGNVCVEDFSVYKALGRVFLRQSGRTIAVGVVTQVFED